MYGENKDKNHTNIDLGQLIVVM